MTFNVFLSVCSQLGLSNAGHFLGWQLQTGLKYLVQAHGPRVQSGADLKVGEWLGNGYEPELKRWLQDGVTKYSRSAGLK